MIPSLESCTITTHDLFGRTLRVRTCDVFPTKREAGSIGEFAQDVKAGAAGRSGGTRRRSACNSGSGCVGRGWVRAPEDGENGEASAPHLTCRGAWLRCGQRE